MRAWGVSIHLHLWRLSINFDVLPLVWRWLFAVGEECWSKGSLLHVFAGPVHFWVADYEVRHLVQVGIDIHRNSFWWDKPVKKKVA